MRWVGQLDRPCAGNCVGGEKLDGINCYFVWLIVPLGKRIRHLDECSFLVQDSCRLFTVELGHLVACAVGYIDIAEFVRDLESRRILQVVEGPLESTSAQVSAIGIGVSTGKFKELNLDISSTDGTAHSDDLVARAAVEFVCSVWNCDLARNSEEELVTISERNLGLQREAVCVLSSVGCILWNCTKRGKRSHFSHLSGYAISTVDLRLESCVPSCHEESSCSFCCPWVSHSLEDELDVFAACDLLCDGPCHCAVFDVDTTSGTGTCASTRHDIFIYFERLRDFDCNSTALRHRTLSSKTKYIGRGGCICYWVDDLNLTILNDPARHCRECFVSFTIVYFVSGAIAALNEGLDAHCTGIGSRPLVLDSNDFEYKSVVFAGQVFLSEAFENPNNLDLVSCLYGSSPCLDGPG